MADLEPDAAWRMFVAQRLRDMRRPCPRRRCAWLLLAIVVVSGLLSRLMPEPGRTRAIEESTGTRFRSCVELDGLPGMCWTADLDYAIAKVRRGPMRLPPQQVLEEWFPQLRRPPGLVLLAFHATTDTNAARNERTAFTHADVRRALTPYTRVLLYQDVMPPQWYRTPRTDADLAADGSANREFQKRTFSTEQEPYYVILHVEANGSYWVVDDYSGLINDIEDFLRFLSKPSPFGRSILQ